MEDLLNIVRSRPDDDTLRLVIADALVQLGDPLGRLIHDEHNGGDRHTLDLRYVAEHRRLLGDLVGHVHPTAYRLGFLGEAVDLGTGPLDSPIWSTVTRLQTGRPDLVIRLACLALTSVDLESVAAFRILLDHGETIPLSRIWPLRVGEDEMAGAWLPHRAGAGLRALTHLALTGGASGEGLWALADRFLDLDLPIRCLRIECHHPPADAQRARWERQPTLQRVEWRGGHWDRQGRGGGATLPANLFDSLRYRGPQAPPELDPAQGLRLIQRADIALAPTLWFALDADDTLVLALPLPQWVRPGELTTMSILPAGALLGPAPWDREVVEVVTRLLEEADPHAGPGGATGVVRHLDGSLHLLTEGGPYAWKTGAEAARRFAADHVGGHHPWAGASTVGPLRALNEDTFGVDPGGVWVVVDGMGGSSSGEVAAALVNLALAQPGDAEARFDAARADLVEAENGSGATAVRLVVEGDQAEVSWVGDCRACLLRGGTFSLLTEDHTLVNEMVRQGRITAEEAPTHPHANIIMRAVQHGTPCEVDRITMTLQPGDRILLVSDGVSQALDGPTVHAILEAAATLADAVWTLLAEACRVDGRDNATAVLVAYDG